MAIDKKEAWFASGAAYQEKEPTRVTRNALYRQRHHHADDRTLWATDEQIPLDIAGHAIRVDTTWTQPGTRRGRALTAFHTNGYTAHWHTAMRSGSSQLQPQSRRRFESNRQSGIQQGVMNIEQRIVDEARRIAAEHGRTPTLYQMREIVRDARRYIDMGMEWARATDYATTHALRLYDQDPPWAG